MFNEFIQAARVAYIAGNVPELTKVMNKLINWISDGQGVTDSELKTLVKYIIPD